MPQEHQKEAQDSPNHGSTGWRVDGTTGNGSTESGSVAGSGAQPLLDKNRNRNNSNNKINNDNKKYNNNDDTHTPIQ